MNRFQKIVYNCIFLCLLFLCICKVEAQRNSTTDSVAKLSKESTIRQKNNFTNTNDVITTSGVTYVDNRYEMHKSFTVDYKLASRIYIQIHGFRHRYVSQDIFGGHIISKGYLSKKLYLFSGIRTEFGLGPSNGISLGLLESISGIGYDVSENFSMQLQFDIDLLSQTLGVFSNTSDFSLYTKFEF